MRCTCSAGFRHGACSSNLRAVRWAQVSLDVRQQQNDFQRLEPVPKYCVENTAQPTGEHIVHLVDSGCSILKNNGDCTGLSDLPGCDHAIRSAGQIFPKIDGCPECVPGCNQSVSADSVNAAVLAAVTISNM